MAEVTIPTVQNYTDAVTVRAVQAALAARGFRPKKGANGGIDGIYGTATKDALRSWQYESGSDDTGGVINYGVLLKLGIPAPGSAAAAQAATNAAAVQAATVRAHAAGVVAAKQAVDVAKAKVEVAPTTQAKEQAKQELVAAEKQLEIVSPSTPMWQWALGILGVGAIGLGAWSLLKKGSRR